MILPVLFGVVAAVATGLGVGLWASIVAAPPEVAGGIAAGVGGVLGFGAFTGTLALRLAKRSMATLTARFARLA